MKIKPRSHEQMLADKCLRLEKENAKLKKQKEEIEIEFSDIKMIEDLERLQKENATLEKQKEYLKKQGDECAITVSQLVLEIKASKEMRKELEEVVENGIEEIGKLSNEIKALKQQIVQYDAANEKLRKENEKLKANLETAVDNLVLTSESEPDLPEFIPTEVRCDFCNYLMGTMIEWGQSIVTDSECPICKSDRFVFVNKKEAGK